MGTYFPIHQLSTLKMRGHDPRGFDVRIVIMEVAYKLYAQYCRMHSRALHWWCCYTNNKQEKN